MSMLAHLEKTESISTRDDMSQQKTMEEEKWTEIVGKGSKRAKKNDVTPTTTTDNNSISLLTNSHSKDGSRYEVGRVGNGHVGNEKSRSSGTSDAMEQSLVPGVSNSSAWTHFDINNDIPNAVEVEKYFRSKPKLSLVQVEMFLARAFKWKKENNINLLTGNNVIFVMASLKCMLSKMSKEELQKISYGTMECLQVISPPDIEKSGS